MTDKVRQVSERSLENLKLGAQSRYQGKQRHNFTVLPETVQWLKGTGNASDAIDVLVEAAKDRGLFSNNTHDREVQLVFNDAYQQNVKELQVSLEETQLELSKLRSQLAEAQGENNFQETRWKLAARMNDEAIDENRKLKNLNEQLQADLEQAKIYGQNTVNQLCECHSDAFKAADILKAALNIPSNTGGKIKAQVREAIKLIDDL
jgi:DNA-binding transcriptional regulator GbsR (MarR family)